MTGGGRPEKVWTAAAVQPTVFADVDNSMTIAQEEIFGPVLAIIPYDTKRTPSGSPTIRYTAWPAACGPRITQRPSRSRRRSGPARTR